MLLPSLKASGGTLWIAGLCFLWDFSGNTGSHAPWGASSARPPGGTVVIHQRPRRPAGEVAQACAASSAQPALRYYFLIYKAPFPRRFPGRSCFGEGSQKHYPARGATPARRKVV